MRSVVAVALLLVLACSQLQPVQCGSGFRVVAFGDSFTEGWDPETEMKQPYTEALRNCLRKWVSRKIGIAVLNRGKGWSGVLMNKPGANLTENVLADIKLIKESKAHFDWAILWIAGVNDIVNAKPPHPFPMRQVLRMYKQLWDACLAMGWKVLVMPQPTFMFAPGPGQGPEKTREALAAQLQQWVKDAAAVNPRLHYFDLATAMNGWRMGPKLAATYYSRKNHFTFKGYSRVGNLVCNLLAPDAIKRIPQSTSTQAVSKQGR